MTPHGDNERQEQACPILGEVLDLNSLSELFGHFYVTTGLSVGLYDTEGTRVLFRGRDQDICALADNCAKCRSLLSYGGKKSAELGEPYIYRCGCGLIMCSSPVLFEDKLIGSIACGPAMLWESDDFARAELTAACTDMPLNVSDETYKGIRQLDCVNMTSAAKILYIMVNSLTIAKSSYLSQRARISGQQARIAELIADKKAAAASVNAIEQNVKLTKYPVETERELIAYVQMGDKIRAKKILNSLLGEIFALAGGDLDIIRARLYELIAFLSRAAVDAGAPVKELAGIIKKASLLMAEGSDYEQICFLTNEAMEGFLDTVYRNRAAKSTKEHLSKAIAYIDSHYADELSLGLVARNVYVSSFYLSHLFRDEMNSTFTDYVTKIRVERAKALLKTPGKKIQEVAESVGFNDSNYFAKAFKKHTGTSPKEYQSFFV